MLARQRTIDQDPAFVLRMLVDIAIRALSPAVNDPTTAVQALDRLEDAARRAARRASRAGVVLDEDGVPRGARPGAHVDGRTWSSASPRSASYGADSVQVCRRLHALYDRLLAEVDGPERARVELERRLLARPSRAAFPDAEDGASPPGADRLGLGCEP